MDCLEPVYGEKESE